MPTGLSPTLLPAVDRPPRGPVRATLLFLLLLDAALLALLPHSPAVLAILAAAAVSLALAGSLPWALALVAMGYPLTDPISERLGSFDPVFYGLRAVLFVSLAWILIARVRRAGRWLGSLLSEPTFLWALALCGIVLLGTLWTPAPVYGRSKVIAYVATNLPLLAGGFFLALRRDDEDDPSRDRRFDRFLKACLILGLAIAFVALANAVFRFYPFRSRLTVLGLNPIWLGRIVGLALLAAAWLWDLGRLSGRTALLAALPLSVVEVLAGSRGPLLAVLFVLAVRWLVFTRAPVLRRAGLLLAGAAGCAVVLLVMPEDVRDRFLHPIRQDPSGVVRLRFLELAREALGYAKGLGIGTGGFADLLGKGDLRFYPHNITAEIAIENGVPGLAAYAGFVLAVLSRGWARLRDPRALVAALGFLYALLNAQFSGDLTANEWIWLFAGIVAGRAR